MCLRRPPSGLHCRPRAGRRHGPSYFSHSFLERDTWTHELGRMSYVDAALAPQRKTGQIKLHGPGAFAGMRKAGQLVAECLDMLTFFLKAGVTTEKIDQLVFEFAMEHQAVPATL